MLERRERDFGEGSTGLAPIPIPKGKIFRETDGLPILVFHVRGQRLDEIIVSSDHEVNRYLSDPEAIILGEHGFIIKVYRA